MYCPNCGSPNEQTAKFCIKCGERFPASGQPDAKVPAPTPPQDTQQDPGPSQAKGRSRLVIVILAVILVLLLILAVELVLLLTGRAEPTPTPSLATHTSIPPTPTMTTTPTSPPASPEAPLGFSDDFGSLNLNPGWTWVDPLGDSSYSLTANPGHLRLYTPDGGHDLYLNLNAPRMVQQVTGDFVARTRVTISPQYTYQGAGLLIWQDADNYISIQRSPSPGIQFAYRIEGTYFDLNPDPYTSQTTVYLQFARTGNSFVASFSNDGTDWQDVYAVSYPAARTLYVGPSLLNEWQDNPIWADFDYFEIRTDK